MLFISCNKLFSFWRYLSFCNDILVMQQNGLIRKIRCLHSSTLGPQNIARTNSWIKDISYSRLYLLKIFKELFRKAKLWCSKSMKRLFITVVFFIDNKKTEKTLWWSTFSKFTTSQLFLTIKTCSYAMYKPQTCSICSESFSP